ncbi:hypothetical protein E6O75_ATG07470 [Venturia nashicola]|uniref:Uncharacterized protein n=1 Tax=Venturia nashicola TaxID=86259 RepID=A0A4Z1P692_9PEZI|nr:hypothetical protein E6O75_ATG07470 [Venturia nashicola]
MLVLAGVSCRALNKFSSALSTQQRPPDQANSSFNTTPPPPPSPPTTSTSYSQRLVAIAANALSSRRSIPLGATHAGCTQTTGGDYIGPLVAPAPALSAAAHVPVPSAAAVATAAIVTPTPAIVSQTAPPAFQDGREEMMK